MLYLLFSFNGLLYIWKRFKIYKFVTTVSAGENRTTSFSMLCNPTFQTVCYTYIQNLI